MSNRFFETPEHMETPETNVKAAALRLMRLKMLVQMGKGSSYPSLDLDDVNEILTVAGFPLITPEELKAPELDIIKVEKEENHDN